MARKLTIGIISNTLDYDYQISILKGIQNYAKESGVNTMCFAGNEINSFDRIRNAKNRIYDAVSGRNVDGIIIVSSTVFNYMKMDEIESYCERFANIPCVSLGIKIRNIPSIIVDNKYGFRKLVDHLIEKHGFSKFLYISGPDNNAESIERFDAFMESVSNHNIKMDPDNIKTGNFFVEPAYYIMKDYLKSGIDFDAVVCANDNMAIGAMKALNESKIMIPDEISVTGFDDIGSAASLISPLTTVRQSSQEMAKKSMKTLLDLCAGKTVSDVEVVNTRLVIRNSCGCMSEVIERVPVFISSRKEKPERDIFINEVVEKMKSLYQDVQDNDIENISKFAELISNVIEGDILQEQYIQNLNKLLQKAALIEFNDDMWDMVISICRNMLIGYQPDKPGHIIKLENLMHQSRVLIKEISKHVEMYARIEISEKTKTLQRIMRELINSFDLKQLFDKMKREFLKIGIYTCYLSLNDGQDKNIENFRLVLAYNRNKIYDTGNNGIIFPSYQLYPRELIHDEERSDLIIEALVYEEELLGIIVLGMNPDEGILISSMNDQLRSTIKASMLMEDAVRKGNELEIALAELNSNYKKLLLSEKMASLGRLTSGIAHEMNSPLAAVRSVLSEMSGLINEYKSSIGQPEVTMEDHYEIVEDMIKSVTLAKKAVENAISFIRSIKIQTREMNPQEKTLFNAVEITNEAILLLSHSLRANNVNLKFQFSKEIIMISGHPGRFSQIITNLITNSIDAIDRNTEGHITITLSEDNGSIILKAEDNGCGISPDLISKIFEPLFTTKPFGHGTGLGLTIIHDIVYGEFMGKIEIKSEEGKGTVFLIIFDRAVNT